MHRTTIAKYTKFSAEELQKSTADPLSCVAAVQLNEILSLRPRDCEHIVKGVKRCVTDKIGRYHAKLNGIVLGYAKIRVDNALSALRLDSPYLHVRTTIDYYVFQPRIGSTLRGTVNYVSKNFVSAVIYRVFNVTVKLGKQTARLHALKNGSDISFTVNSCDMKSELPVIEGELVLNGVIPVRIKTEQGAQNGGDCDEVEEVAMETDAGVKQEPKTPKKKASKKSKEVPEAVSRAATPPATNGVTAGMPLMDDSSSSESENDERSLLIKSLLGEMFGDEFTESTKSSKKDKKKKDKKEKKQKKKSPQKSTVPVETVRIKKEVLSSDEDEPSAAVEQQPTGSTQGKAKSKKNGTNGVRLNGSAATPASPDAVNGETTTTPAKKRKIRFDLNDTVVHIKTEPTESSKKKKKNAE
ncbi:probable DNA-directed RNA polymerase I subunit RPA43 [Anopheles merus]|uniref:probable DNA-directed RNA polymerase I subunit RPA43 n=1 Tax=Anopheles merus TaxID=30066 RepID=UPI001BE47197|nr:probable DNA-directed RNA polymerase I subunit RPA43 [Anopheles merus]